MTISLVIGVAALPSDAASLDTLVHVPRFPADESFVGFDFAREFRSQGFVLHRQPDAMEHQPCRLLRDTHVFSDLATADSVLAVQDHPHGGEPLVQRNSRILHDGSDLDGELALGVMFRALPGAPLGVETDLIRATSGADHSPIRPAPYRQVINAVIGIREVQDCFLKALWFVAHNVLHEPKYSKFLRASQVNNCLN